MNVPGSAPSEAGGHATGLLCAILAVTLAGFGISLTHPLFAVLLERQGYSGLAIGLSSSSLAIAMLAGGLLMPRVVARTGLIPVMGAAAACCSTTLLLAGAMESYFGWIVTRFCFSLGATALFYGSELWIVSAAPPARRGLWLGIYGFVLSGGFLSGPLLLNAVGTEGWPPFLWAALIMAMAALPVIAGARHAPRHFGASPAGVLETLRFFRTDPSLIWGVVLYSVFEFGVLGLLPVWGLRIGLEEGLAIALVALVPLGNMLLELPMGIASDRYPRRVLMMICAAGALATGLLMPLWAGWEAGLTGLLLLAGGVVVGLYVLPLAEFGARYSGDALSRANGAVIVGYGLGALLAPTFLGQAMDLAGPHGLPWGLALLAGIYLALLAWRGRSRGA
ncbi:MFS transporter [Oceanicella sp. SM1341]|uniref:MFS transporter n=1 Tax=Oceanicella sp. SM1341 TaxID=1548889 RepID=UPI000E4B6BA8|nr:MFS transporter [Oceanicella sp. SM1341]